MHIIALERPSGTASFIIQMAGFDQAPDDVRQEISWTMEDISPGAVVVWELNA